MYSNKTPVEIVNSLKVGDVVYDATIYFQDDGSFSPVHMNVTKYTILDFPTEKKTSPEDTNAYRFAVTYMGEKQNVLAEHVFMANTETYTSLTENSYYRYEHGVLSLFLVV